MVFTLKIKKKHKEDFTKALKSSKKDEIFISITLYTKYKVTNGCNYIVIPINYYLKKFNKNNKHFNIPDSVISPKLQKLLTKYYRISIYLPYNYKELDYWNKYDKEFIRLINDNNFKISNDYLLEYDYEKNIIYNNNLNKKHLLNKKTKSLKKLSYLELEEHSVLMVEIIVFKLIKNDLDKYIYE